MENKNIKSNTSKNVILVLSSGTNTPLARSGIQQGNRSSVVATDLQTSPQVADPHYTRLMRLLKFQQPLTAQECIDLVYKIENKDLQKKAYVKIVEHLKLQPEALLSFCEQVKNPAEIEQPEAIIKENNRDISLYERYTAAESIKDIKEREKVYSNIAESLHFGSEDSIHAADLIVDSHKLDHALSQLVLEGMHSRRIHLPECVVISKRIQDKKLQEQVLLTTAKDRMHNLDFYDLGAVIEILDLISPSAERAGLTQELCKNFLEQDIVKNCRERKFDKKDWDGFVNLIRLTFSLVDDSELKNKLLTQYFKIHTLKGHNAFRSPDYLDDLKALIRKVYDVANQDHKAAILLQVVNSIYGDLEGVSAYKDLLGEIHARASRELRKELAYLLLKKLMRVRLSLDLDMECLYSGKNLGSYAFVLELFMPVASVYDEDIEDLIANVLSQAPHLDGQTWTAQDGRNLFWEKLGCFCHTDMCMEVLNLYMPSAQISTEKKQLMVEAIVCNQSFSKDFRKNIIKKYIQNSSLAEELLLILDQDPQDLRFKKTKEAAREEDHS